MSFGNWFNKQGSKEELPTTSTEKESDVLEQLAEEAAENEGMVNTLQTLRAKKRTFDKYGNIEFPQTRTSEAWKGIGDVNPSDDTCNVRGDND